MQFTTEDLPLLERPDAWRVGLRRLGLTCRAEQEQEPVFGSILSRQSAGGLHLALLVSSPQSLSFLPSIGQSACWLFLMLEGAATIGWGSEKVSLATGDTGFAMAGPQLRLIMQKGFRLLLVGVPRHALTARLLPPNAARIGRVLCADGTGHILAALLRSTAEALENFTTIGLQTLEVALPEFILPVVSAVTASNGAAGPAASQSKMLLSVCRAIEAQLGDPDLTLAQVAEEQGMSVRSVQKLFKTANDHFVNYIRRRRLERCRGDLANPLYASVSVTELCFRWGFNAPAHFSRAFREQFGKSPRQFRQEALLDCSADPRPPGDEVVRPLAGSLSASPGSAAWSSYGSSTPALPVSQSSVQGSLRGATLPPDGA